MHDNENSSLAELLSKDERSRAFFCTLSPELRRSLMNRDIDTFETLKFCADNYRCGQRGGGGEIYGCFNSACSSNDCTGLIPAGSDKTQESFDEFKQLYPFSNPPQT